MAKAVKSVDVSKVPDLLRLAEEVRDTQAPYILQCNGEDLAILMPIAPASKHRPRRAKASADEEALLLAAGGWKDLVDAEELKARLAGSRGSDRPSVEL